MDFDDVAQNVIVPSLRDYRQSFELKGYIVHINEHGSGLPSRESRAITGKRGRLVHPPEKGVSMNLRPSHSVGRGYLLTFVSRRESIKVILYITRHGTILSPGPFDKIEDLQFFSHSDNVKNLLAEVLQAVEDIS